MSLIKKNILLLLILFLSSGIIRAEKITEFINHSIPDSLHIHRDIIIITEGYSVYIYSFRNHKLLAKFGKEGEGPEEFKSSPIVNIEEDYILINSPGKVSFYSRKGIYIKELNNIYTGRFFKKIGENFIGYKTYVDNAGIRYSGINIYDPQFVKIREVYNYEFIAQSQRGKGWHLFTKTYIEPLVCENKIIVAGDKEFVINVYDKSGEVLTTIKRKYDRVKFTEENKKKVLDLYRTRPSTAPDYPFWKKNIVFPEYFPAIRSIYTADNKLYIRTYRIKNKKSEFFIYSTDRKLIKHIFLYIAPSYIKNAYPYMKDFSPFTFSNGKLYQLILNEETEKISLFSQDI